ncbi:PREDICTED: uncharacterized protein LOC107346755 [Acropora digitifera]|uniref:uncharacterized protein LOC107346755 n=1 Tax=Acropora digitifera TaxID=70779 RepID=UPI00077ACE57|nr:PREDICTED: uncharacterized protein LOC107346755 [Acropora digitifera]
MRVKEMEDKRKGQQNHQRTETAMAEATSEETATPSGCEEETVVDTEEVRQKRRESWKNIREKMKANANAPIMIMMLMTMARTMTVELLHLTSWKTTVHDDPTQSKDPSQKQRALFFFVKNAKDCKKIIKVNVKIKLKKKPCCSCGQDIQFTTTTRLLQPL